MYFILFQFVLFVVAAVLLLNFVIIPLFNKEESKPESVSKKKEQLEKTKQEKENLAEEVQVTRQLKSAEQEVNSLKETLNKLDNEEK